MELRGNGADRKFTLARLASDFSLFDFSLTTHPALLFSRTDFHPRSTSYLGIPFIPAFCLVQRIKGTPLPDSNARPANFIMYILPTTGHLCPKKMLESAGHSSDRRMRARMIATNNCDLSCGDAYIFYHSFQVFLYGRLSRLPEISSSSTLIYEYVSSTNFINLLFLIFNNIIKKRERELK